MTCTHSLIPPCWALHYVQIVDFRDIQRLLCPLQLLYNGKKIIGYLPRIPRFERVYSCIQKGWFKDFIFSLYENPNIVQYQYNLNIKQRYMHIPSNLVHVIIEQIVGVVNNFIAIVFIRNNQLHLFYFNILYLKKSEIPIREDILYP